MRHCHVLFTSVLMCILAAFLAGADLAIAQETWGDEPNQNLGEEAQSPAEEERLLATTDYRHVAGSAFVPLYGDAGVTYGSKGCVFLSNATHLFMNYSLDLPNNSTVTVVRLYFNDTAATDGTLYLAQYDDGASYTYLATVTTSGSGGLGSATLSGLNIQLDYVNYSYVLYWVPGVSGSTMQLCGFRVSYTEPVN